MADTFSIDDAVDTNAPADSFGVDDAYAFELNPKQPPAAPAQPESFGLDDAVPDKLPPAYPRVPTGDPGMGNTSDLLTAIGRDPGAFLKSIPQGAQNLIEAGASAALNAVPELHRAATGMDFSGNPPVQGVITKDDQGRDVLKSEPEPLPFQPGQPILPSDATVMNPEGSDANRLLGSLTSPGMLATLPFAAAKPVQALFLGQTAAGAVDAAGRLLDPTADRKQAAQDLLLNGAMALGIGAHIGDTPSSLRAKALAEQLNQSQPQVPGREVAPLVQASGQGGPAGPPYPVAPPQTFSAEDAVAPVKGAGTATGAVAEAGGAPTLPEQKADIPLLPVDVTDSQIKAMKGPAEERPADLLDTISDNWPNGVKFESKADYGDYVKAATGGAKDLMSHTEGEPADQVLDALKMMGTGQTLDSVDDLAQAMVDAGGARAGAGDERTAQARVLAESLQRDKLFADANDPDREGTQPVSPSQLYMGDTVKLNGQPMRVTGFDTDEETGAPRGVEMEGAYGKQLVPASRNLHIDAGSHTDENGVAQNLGRVAASGTSAPRSGGLYGVEPGGTQRVLNNRKIPSYFNDDFADELSRMDPDRASGVIDLAQNVLGKSVVNWRAAQKALQSYADELEGEAVSWDDHDDFHRLWDYVATKAHYEAKDRGRIAASGTSQARPTIPKSPLNPPPGARPVTVPNTIASSPAPAVHPVSQWFSQHTTGVRSVVAPQSLGPVARGVGNALRHFMGKNALAMARADDGMKAFRSEFDKSPVPANWKFNPAQPLPHNYAVIDALERDPASLPQRYQDLAKTFQNEFAWRIAKIQKYAPDALQKLITNYFPHVWEDPKRAGDVMAQVATRLFAGRKEFLKQRSLPFFRDGLERGLKPVSDNPVDMLMAKMNSMDKFILALRSQSEFKASGAMRFKYVLEKMPDGWQAVDDPAFTVHAPPVVTIKEAFDAQLRTRTQEFLKKLGVKESRLATLGGKRWGMAYESPEQIKTRFGGPMSVYWHELGHILDYRYDLQNSFIKQGGTFDKQLRDLADRRLPAAYPRSTRVLQKSTGKLVNRPTSFTKYVRSAPEKMAVMSEAYVHAPDVFQRVAPDVYKQFDNFIETHPELHDIRDIKPSLRLDTASMEQKLPGVLKLGDWIMPDGGAAVVKNYLSPGLSQYGAFRTFKSASNILNAAQLGLSGFHLGFTSLDAATSRLAIGLEDLSRGHVAKAAKTFASVPSSPVTNLLQGRRMIQEALHPGTTDAETADLVKALEAGGGRIGQDKFWQTDFLRRLRRAMAENTASGYLKSIPLAALTGVEQAMRPIMEYIVPRQKLGVFADMARRELERLGPNADPSATREAMRKAWDSVDNRMGQVVYDNLFYNRAVKDLALMSFRAYGWQLGKYREGFGAMADTAEAAKNLALMRKPEVSHRMAYAMALPLMVGLIGGTMNYLMTGQRPQDWRDYFMPRSGELDQRGNARRLNLPSYMKDVIAYGKHPVESFGHSLNPMFSAMGDLLANKDFYDTQIRNPDDPLWKQGGQVAEFAAKQFIPFSVSGTMKLRQDAAPMQKQVLPFFGITPVPQRMVMTPAQELAAEITGANLPGAPRTQEQFDKSKLIAELVQDFRTHQNDAGQAAMAKGFQSGQLNARSVQTMMDKLNFTPLQFQVHHMDVPSAMRVWRVANPQERTTLAPMIETKLATTKTLTADQIKAFADELSRK